jgi:hypothetical protein
MSLDAKKDFQKDPQKVALIPSDERIQAVIRATSQGQIAGGSSGAEMRLGAAGALVGAAARKLSAQNEPDVVGGLSARWPADAALDWIVLTDRSLHVFRTTKDQPRVLDPNGAVFALNEVEHLDIGQSFAVKPMKFVFTDGSAVTVDAPGGMKTDGFTAAAGRAFSGGVAQGLKDTTGFWIWGWLGIFGLMLGALATGAGATTEAGTSSLVLSVVAAVCAALATWWWITRWHRAGWKWWGAALTLLILGAILTGASFDKESCDCRGMIWLAAPFAVLGLVALVGRAVRRT